MKRFILALAIVGLLANDPFSLWNQTKHLLAQQNSPPYSLQVASLPNKISAQKEIKRLKASNIQAQSFPSEGSSNKTWFVIFINMGFQTKTEAIQYGNQLIQKGIIKTFKVSFKKGAEEIPTKVEEQPMPSAILSKKEPIPIPGQSPVYVGPIFSKETGEEKLIQVKEDPPLSSNFFNLHVASFSTLEAVQKELNHLKSFKIEAKYALRENQSKKKSFVIYLDRFKSKEEATRKGNQLVQKNIIKNFMVYTQKPNEETQTTQVKEGLPSLSTKAKEGPPAPITPSKKEPSSSLDKSSVSFGPISIREEEKTLSITILLDRKIFPEITADKIAEGSRLIITFKNIDQNIVPIDFDKFQSKTLISLSLVKKGSECIFNILLNSTFNYEVAQNYFEKEKLYSLLISRE
ncbi:MAG: hypothetical protein C0407_03430 [Desulfobacca sp.]|nr:hypothetical protein [Desulfobacca sp.]